VNWEDIPIKQLEKYSQDPPADLAVVLESRLDQNSFVLDVGCGGGRHLRFLSERGHRPVGIDPNRSAVQAVRNVLPGIPVHQMVMDSEFPFSDGSFDAVLSTYAIYHGVRTRVEKTLEESLRVLRAGGLFFINLISVRDFKYGVGPEVEADSFIDIREGEPEVIHHFFNLEAVMQLCRCLSKFELGHEERPIDQGGLIAAVPRWDCLSAHWVVKGTK
jgi:SAM-dependent methyltransferase